MIQRHRSSVPFFLPRDESIVARRRWGWWGAVADLGSWPKIAIRLIEGSDKLPAARPAGASLARKGNNLPVLALQHIPELSVENLPVGRRHLQAECVVTVAQQLATNFEPRTAYETRQGVVRCYL